jgi:CheY-like chemotaxis protein
MDMQMPGMDGLAATRAIRARGTEIHQPRIVAMTANALDTDRNQCIAAGMDDHLAKPIDRERLAMLVLGERATMGVQPSTRAVAHDREINSVTFDELSIRIGSEAVVSIVDLFLRDASDILGALRKSVLRADAQRLARNAHTLKSTAATLGAERLSRYCAELEALGEAGSLESAEHKLESVALSLAAARIELAAKSETAKLARHTVNPNKHGIPERR